MSRLGTVASAVLTKYYAPGAGIMSTPDTPDLTIDGDVRFKAKVRRAALTPSGTLFLQLHSGRSDLLNEYRTDASTPAADAYRIGRWAPAQATRNMLAGTEVNQTIPAETDVHIGYTMVSTDRTRWQAIRSDDGSAWVNVGNAYVEASNLLGAFPDDTAALRVGYLWQGRFYWAQMEAINRARLVFPGVAGNYLSIPYQAVTQPTGDIEVVARVSCPNWTAPTGVVLAKNGPFYFVVANTGTIGFWTTVQGQSATFPYSTAHGFVNGGTYWIKATRVAATGVTAFYTAPDSPTEPVSWTARGTVTGVTGVLSNNTSSYTFGAYNNGIASPFTGRVLRTILRDGIAGPTVLDVSENNAGTMATADTFLATSGQTVTVNSTGTVPFLDPTIGSLTIPDPGPLPAESTVVARFRYTDLTSNPYIVAHGSSGGSYAWRFFFFSGALHMQLTEDGSSTFRPTTLCASVAQLTAAGIVPNTDVRLAATLDYDDGTGRVAARAFVSADGVTWTPVAPALAQAPAVTAMFDTTSALRVGAFNTGAGFLNGRIYSVECRTGLDPTAGTVLWRFDAAEYPGTGTSYVDPRGRTWTLSAAGAILPAVAPIVQPQPNSLVWRFDAADAPFTGTSYTDPRGRTWTMPAGAIVGI